MSRIELAIDGVASWSSAWPDWRSACAVLRGEAAPADPPLARPPALLLAGNERRRAPLAVVMALEAAAAAVSMSGHDASQMASVFTSAHGDLATTDALCSTLAHDPRLLSPTRFHHSVHNAPSGYWAVATGCHAPSTALAAHGASFATGLLEAALLVAEQDAPVLLVGCDTEATGTLASTNTSRGLLALALVLAPRPARATRWCLTLDVGGDETTPAASIPITAGVLHNNALADALPLCHALSTARACTLALSLDGGASLRIGLAPIENFTGTPRDP